MMTYVVQYVLVGDDAAFRGGEACRADLWQKSPHDETQSIRKSQCLDLRSEFCKPTLVGCMIIMRHGKLTSTNPRATYAG